MQKGNTLIFLLVGILVLVGGTFYLGRQTTPKPSPVPVATSQTPQPTSTPDASPTPTGAGETATWKTYSSDEYKFIIMYPPQVTHNETLGSTQFNKSHEFLKVDGGTLEIYGVCGRGVQPIKQQDIVIGGQKATKLYETNANGIITAIPRPNSNESICFNFTLPNNSIKINSVDALFDKILSTFKFTN